MSSHVRTHIAPVRTVTVRTVTVKGDTTFSMSDILGSGGQKLLHDTLESLPAMQRKLGLEKTGEDANWFNWEKVDSSSRWGNEDHYRIQVASPKGLQGFVNIDLRIGSSVAEISYLEKIETQQKVQEKQVQQAVQQTVNQTVNNLLAVAVARRMNEQVQQYAKQYQRQEVHMRVRESNVETYGFVGGR